MLEWPPLCQAAQTVVVIDHHRKMVDFIDNAVIFYHEPYSSSASEMVAELVQYMAGLSLIHISVTIYAKFRHFVINIESIVLAYAIHSQGSIRLASLLPVLQLVSRKLSEYCIVQQLVMKI